MFEFLFKNYYQQNIFDQKTNGCLPTKVPHHSPNKQPITSNPKFTKMQSYSNPIDFTFSSIYLSLLFLSVKYPNNHPSLHHHQITINKSIFSCWTASSFYFINNFITTRMLLGSTRKHSKSLSCTLLQKQLQKDHKNLRASHRSNNPEFVPYCQQRKLGRIINKQEQSSSRKLSETELLERINFRNFHKIYQMVSKYENDKYSQLTRKTQQKNLLNKEWKVHSIAKLPNRSSMPPIIRPKEQEITSESKEKFAKMNEVLFKKLNQVKQPTKLPQFQEMYDNYIKICELNENIRRVQLLKGVKQQ